MRSLTFDMSLPVYNPTGISSYNANPSPRGGSGLFGGVPGAIKLPNPFLDLSKVYPNLYPANKGASAALTGELGGTLSPLTLDSLRDRNAERSVSAGMPGAGLYDNALLSDVGKASYAQQRQGLGDYGPLAREISRTETVAPSLAEEIARINATNSALPDPTIAGSLKALTGLAGFAGAGGFGSFGGSNTGYGGYNYDYSNFANPEFKVISEPTNYGEIQSYGSPMGNLE